MAVSIDIDQTRGEQSFGSIALNELQKVFSDDTKLAESVESISSKPCNDNHINDIVFSDDMNNVNNTIVDNSDSSPALNRALSTYVENFGLAEKRLLKICDGDNISLNSTTDSMLQFGALIDEQQNNNLMRRESLMTTLDNLQIKSTTERHIMISYNDLSSDICQKICHRLQQLGYKVWMDEYDLHGKILEGMAEGIQNAYLVLLCYTEKYAKSYYCHREAVYTFQKHIDFIPCRLQDSYDPDGWLGILISDRLYIDFSPSNEFEKSFKQLVNEIEAIKAQSNTCCNRLTNGEICKRKVREQFNTIIREYKESVNKNDLDLNLLDKEELCELISRLREQLFNDNLSSSNRNCEEQNLVRDQTLRNLFQQSQNQTELLENITHILSNPIDCKTIIKLSMAFMFVWTVKTHIIDAYLKQ